jgi:excisionase family DNA binding protein
MTEKQPQSRVPSRLLTVAEAAQFLGCSETNVYALIDSGDLPFVSIGKRKGYRLDQMDLEAFIDRRTEAIQSRGISNEDATTETQTHPPRLI